MKDTIHHKNMRLDDQDHSVVPPPPTSGVSNNSTPPQLQKISGQQSNETVERKQGVLIFFTYLLFCEFVIVYKVESMTDLVLPGLPHAGSLADRK